MINNVTCTRPTPDEVEQDGADFIRPECAGAAFVSGQTVSSSVLLEDNDGPADVNIRLLRDCYETIEPLAATAILVLRDLVNIRDHCWNIARIC